MSLAFLHGAKYMFPLCGALIGGYKGYGYALKKKEMRWGKYAHLFQSSIVPIGFFTGLGFGIGYYCSKLF